MQTKIEIFHEYIYHLYHHQHGHRWYHQVEVGRSLAILKRVSKQTKHCPQNEARTAPPIPKTKPGLPHLSRKRTQDCPTYPQNEPRTAPPGWSACWGWSRMVARCPASSCTAGRWPGCPWGRSSRCAPAWCGWPGWHCRVPPPTWPSAGPGRWSLPAWTSCRSPLTIAQPGGKRIRNLSK